MKHIIEINRLKGFKFMGISLYWNISPTKTMRAVIESDNEKDIDKVWEALKDLTQSYLEFAQQDRKVS